MGTKPTYKELEQKVKGLEKEVVQLKLAEEQLSVAINRSPIPTAMGGSDGAIIAYNEALENLIGYKRSEIKDVTVWANKLYPDEKYRDFVWKNIRQALEGKEQDCTEFTITCKDGSTKVINFKTSFFQGGLIIQMIDITDRKWAEEELRESEERFRETVDLLPSIVCEYDTKGRFTYVNNYGLETFGYSLSDLEQGLYATQMFPPGEMENFKDRFSLLLKGEKPASCEYRLQHKDGSIIYVIADSAPIYKDGKIAGVRSSITPITERKRTEEALLKSEEKYRELADSLPQVVFEMDENGVITFANRNAFDFFGYTQNDFDEGVNALQMLIPEHRDRAMENIQMRLIGKKVGHQEYTAQRKDGSTFPVAAHVNPILLENRPVGLRGIIIDITERKRAEEEQQKLASVIKYSSELVNLATLDGKMIFLNESGSKMLGIDPDKVERIHIMEVIPDHMKKLVRNELLPALKQGNTWEGELQYCNIKTGDLIDVYARTFTVRRPNTRKPLFLANVSMDITDLKLAEEEKKKLEAQLQQAHKVESIGTLAGGIAHDFNNILSPIILHTEMVLENISKEGPLRFSLKEILRASLRAKDLVKQILTFSRQAEQERIPLIINPVIKEAIRLLRSSLPSTIEIRQKIEAEDIVILADPTQIHQILMNLCTNAANAMRESGGVLEVGLVDVDLHSDDTNHFVDSEPGQYIKLTVSDTGHGIEPAIMNKIFNPYFTTQEKGKGTGLGLSVVHGIVNTHGGHISTYSELGNGTRFDVYLPLFDSADIKAETVSPEKLAAGDEHILLVDDEKGIVDVVQQMLVHLGYQVTVRTSSIEALEVFRASMDKFDLVITDQTMPNMTGKELAKELMSIRPNIPIILCTGFSEQIGERRAKEMGISAFIMKPIVMKEMANTIRHLMDLAKEGGHG